MSSPSFLGGRIRSPELPHMTSSVPRLESKHASSGTITIFPLICFQGQTATNKSLRRPHKNMAARLLACMPSQASENHNCEGEHPLVLVCLRQVRQEGRDNQKMQKCESNAEHPKAGVLEGLRSFRVQGLVVEYGFCRDHVAHVHLLMFGLRLCHCRSNNRHHSCRCMRCVLAVCGAREKHCIYTQTISKVGIDIVTTSELLLLTVLAAPAPELPAPMSDVLLNEASPCEMSFQAAREEVQGHGKPGLWLDNH